MCAGGGVYMHREGAEREQRGGLSRLLTDYSRMEAGVGERRGTRCTKS